MTDIHSNVFDDDDFDTILSGDIDFSGTIYFEKPFLIRGKVVGTIDAKGLLVIDKGALVEASISTSRVVIGGTVKGDIHVTEALEITASGRLTGNVSVPEGGFVMAGGCIFNGSCVMTGDGGKDTTKLQK
jgi:cytoskeletal protein CcmA (bactofilin family)